MMNLHAMVRGAIPALHPDESVTLRQSVGQKNVRGRIVPVYAPGQTVAAQIQSLGSDDLQHTEAVNLTQRDRKAYFYAPDAAMPPTGIVRPLARNGDMMQRADGSWWLVTAMLEDFTASGWVCVGIVQQLEGPDLSESEETPEEETPDMERPPVSERPEEVRG